MGGLRGLGSVCLEGAAQPSPYPNHAPPAPPSPSTSGTPPPPATSRPPLAAALRLLAASRAEGRLLHWDEWAEYEAAVEGGRRAGTVVRGRWHRPPGFEPTPLAMRPHTLRPTHSPAHLPWRPPRLPPAGTRARRRFGAACPPRTPARLAALPPNPPAPCPPGPPPRASPPPGTWPTGTMPPWPARARPPRPRQPRFGRRRGEVWRGCAGAGRAGGVHALRPC